jgi:hypothetical protein
MKAAGCKFCSTLDRIMKKNRGANGAKKPPAFVSRAERAFARVVRKVRAENQKLGLRAVVWSNGKRAITQ